MKQPFSPFFLGHSALIGCILAVSAVAQSPMSTSSVASINNLKNAAYCSDTSVSANAITCSTAVGFTGYAAGQAVDVLLANTVTGATTININGLGAKAVTYNGTNALTSAIGWNAGSTARLVYDGTRLVMQGIVSTGGSCPAGSANQVQYYVSAGVCGGDPGFTFDPATGIATVGNEIIVGVQSDPTNALSVLNSAPITQNSYQEYSQIGMIYGPSGTTDGSDALTLITALYLTGSGHHVGQAEVNYAYFDGSAFGPWTGTVDQVSLYYAQRPVQGGGTLTTVVDFYGASMAGNPQVATNAYYLWFDSPGVRRVKEDDTFDGNGQAIEALYNHSFAKYTPGAANYERVILGQWNGNVAEIGTEAGGTGTLRGLRLLGTNVFVPFVDTVPTTVASLPSCASGTWGTRGAVTDATAPTIGLVLTGGGTVFATVHCSKTTSTYFVDGL